MTNDLQLEDWRRKSFSVKVARVTDENMEAVAKWCSGEIHKVDRHGKRVTHQKYIKVNVRAPKNDRQTMAFVGDYVLYTNNSFKVYTESAFLASFEPDEDVLENSRRPLPEDIPVV